MTRSGRQGNQGLSDPHLPLQEMKPPGFGNSLGAALHAQLAAEVQDVFLDRVHTEDEVLGDLTVGRAIQQQL